MLHQSAWAVVAHKSGNSQNFGQPNIFINQTVQPVLQIWPFSSKELELTKFLMILNLYPKVIVAEAPVYDGFLAERLAPIVLAAQEQFKFSHILAGSSAIRDTIQ